MIPSSSNQNPMFNEVMDGCGEKTLCMKITKTITSEGYKKNFLPRINKIIAEYGEVRILIYFQNFKGWEIDAARHDMEAFGRIAKKISKIALVNPPESEVFRRAVKKEILNGELKLFNESDLEQAIEWANS